MDFKWLGLFSSPGGYTSRGVKAVTEDFSGGRERQQCIMGLLSIPAVRFCQGELGLTAIRYIPLNAEVLCRILSVLAYWGWQYYALRSQAGTPARLNILWLCRVSFSGTKGSKRPQSDACQFFHSLATKYQQHFLPRLIAWNQSHDPTQPQGLGVVFKHVLRPPDIFSSPSLPGQQWCAASFLSVLLLWPWGEAVETTLELSV